MVTLNEVMSIVLGCEVIFTMVSTQWATFCKNELLPFYKTPTVATELHWQDIFCSRCGFNPQPIP